MKIVQLFIIVLIAQNMPLPVMGFSRNHIHTGTNVRRKASSSTSLQSTSQVLQSIGAFYANSPCEAAMITCGFKASLADIVAQIRQHTGIIEDDSNTDLNNNNKKSAKTNANVATADDNSKKNTQQLIELDRNLSFFLYGSLYQGLAQYFLYNNLFTYLFGNTSDPLVVLTKVMFDMAIIAPNLPLPLSYTIKAIISGKTAKDGLEKYATDVVRQDLLFKYWAFWGPIQGISFSVIPDHYRIVFMAAFSFVWMTILSTISSTEVGTTSSISRSSASAKASEINVISSSSKSEKRYLQNQQQANVFNS